MLLFYTRGISLFLLILVIICLLTTPVRANDRQKSDQLVIRGLKLLKENQPEEAKNLLDKAVEADQTNDKAYKALGDYYSKVGNIKEAIEYYDRSIDLGGDSHSLNFQIALIYFENDDYKKSAIRLKRLKKLEKFQHNAQYWYLLGESYRKQEKFEEAKSALERAVGIRDDYARANFALGELYFNNKKFYKAKECFQSVLESSETDEKMKDKAEQYLIKINNILNKGNLWTLLIPIVVLTIILLAYQYLRKQKLKSPPEEEEFYG